MSNSYEIKKGRIAWVFTAALAGMRKPDEWVIYPKPADSDEVQIQCDTRIARFNIFTGEGVMSKRRQGANFMDLSKFMGATDWVAPKELCEALQACTGIVGNAAMIRLSSHQEPEYITV